MLFFYQNKFSSSERTDATAATLTFCRAVIVIFKQTAASLAGQKNCFWLPVVPQRAVMGSTTEQAYILKSDEVAQIQYNFIMNDKTAG